MERNFNPHSPRGERPIRASRRSPRRYFNPHSPRGERRSKMCELYKSDKFQSTLPARGATPPRAAPVGGHAYFNPHSPRGERRFPGNPLIRVMEFQSTLPARGATLDAGPYPMTPRDFNPHSPRGERHQHGGKSQMKNVFQSTLPARGATAAQADAIYDAGIFQSTLPARGATESAIIPDDFREISIHTPREGSDSFRGAYIWRLTDFNPHSPRGERPLPSARWIFVHQFQSTLPARGATISAIQDYFTELISIHTPREGSDRPFISHHLQIIYFNPHSPRGERLCLRLHLQYLRVFQSTLPARGATMS